MSVTRRSISHQTHDRRQAAIHAHLNPNLAATTASQRENLSSEIVESSASSFRRRTEPLDCSDGVFELRDPSAQSQIETSREASALCFR